MNLSNSEKLRRVHQELHAIKNSARWRIGNALVRLAEIALGRLKPPSLAIDRAIQLSTRAVSTSEDEPSEVLITEKIHGDCQDILVFPVIDWDFRFQRPQHICTQFAKAGHRVFYFSTTFSGQPEDSFAPSIAVVAMPMTNIYRVDIRGLQQFNIYEEKPTEDFSNNLSKSILKFVIDNQLTNPIALVQLPFWQPVVDKLPGLQVVYDCMDYHRGFNGSNYYELEGLETLLVDTCDLMITSSEWLQQKFATADRVPVLVRNGCDPGFFKPQPIADKDVQKDKYVAGYVGAIADWFDFDLLVATANLCPEVDFVLAGHVSDPEREEQLSALANVRLLGEIAYDEVPAFIESTDCCLIPFAITPLTRATDPVKIYEYAAMGKPVVATPMPELLYLESDLIQIADNPESFASAIRLSLAEKNNENLMSVRRKWATEQSWSRRALSFENSLASSRLKTSVVILCFNNLSFSKACVDSVLRFSDLAALELIIVDNGSSDGTAQYFEHLANQQKYSKLMKLIVSELNLGFAGGNNLGIQEATGDFIVILNNDTYVTPNWLNGMQRHFKMHSDLGVLGPVTNNIGNEAKIDIEYRSMREMLFASHLYCSARPRESLDVRVAAFFCVMLKAEVVAEIGLLDESYGLGFFEDDDYCERVRRKGYQVKVASDVFVHHQLSASFDNLPREERALLFENNKKIFEGKWGRWLPHEGKAD